MGKKKIEISRIEKKASRLVTFTKRRQGLFNKAYELCILCGVDITILTFSPAGNPYAFGIPSPDLVIDRYTRYSQGRPAPAPSPPAAPPSSNLLLRFDDINASMKFSQMEHQLQIHSHGKRSTRGNGGGYWWDCVNVDDYVDVNDLQRLKNNLERLRGKVWARIEELSGSFFFPPIPSVKRVKIEDGLAPHHHHHHHHHHPMGDSYLYPGFPMYRVWRWSWTSHGPPRRFCDREIFIRIC